MKVRFFLITLTLMVTLAQANAKVRLGVFDISFFKPHDILFDYLSSDLVITDHHLYSPHGMAVSSLLVNPRYGGDARGEIALMSTGITYEDFEKGVELAISQGVRLVNISMTLREERMIDLLNQAYEEHGILFVVSAGNSAIRFGRELAPYYRRLQALVVSCVTAENELTPFSQIDQSVDFLTVCGQGDIPTQIVDPRLGAIEYAFGMTSAAAPKMARLLIEALEKDPTLNLAQAYHLLKSLSSAQLEHQERLYPIIP